MRAMRLVTRCPHCLALYEVRSAQQQAAQGWLRCGQCLTAFDSEGLVLPWMDEPEFVQEDKIDIRSLLHEPVVASQATEPSPSLADAQSAIVSNPPWPEPQEPSAQSRLWGWASSAAVLLLLVQLLVWHRSALEMALPVVHRWAHAACDLAGCRWPAVQHSAALYLDSARLIREEQGLVLELRIRNQSPVQASVGMLELGLTGTDDQVLVRRVLTPLMLGAPDVLAPAEAWEGRVQLNLMSPLAVTGYRAALFAP
jgi:predicted Zn finger-like uncharacterized protein